MGSSKNSFRIVRQGKRAYLDFLRNLTPQTLLFSFVIITGRQLDFSKIDLSNTMPTVLFYTLLLSFIVAVYCNCSLLLNTLYPGKNEWVNRYYRRANKLNGSKFYNVYFVVLAALRKRYIALLELLVVFFFLQITIAVVIVVALKSVLLMGS
ncbi:hypothetical protein [Paraglaciecola sp. T6c]|uniref:hypothetical protein n=1 Tax=Pseudoalteromonas atlantica (strain T6c / ATCC BAA-1087) TaxID=3042615 RepID=UPI0012ECED8A|nr:hypothetical protein [Paraglaciecola sp. T6c]